MPFLKTAHHTLHYITAGHAQQPALLMLHGFLGNRQDFNRIIPALKEHFYCILPDLPGHGQTLTQPNCYTFSATSKSLLDLLNSLNCQQAYLLGYSMGGRIALYTLHRFPDRFIKGILESASPGLNTEEERQARKKRDWAIAQKLETMPFPEFLNSWYKNELFQSIRVRPELYEEMRSRRQNNNAIELAKALCGFSTGLQDSLWPALTDISNPILLIVGEQDRKFIEIAQAMVAAQHSNNQQIKLKCCADCGHNVHLEASDRYAQIIIQYSLFA